MTSEALQHIPTTTDLDRPLTAGQIRAGVNLIQEVMQSVMKEGVHFGKIPGTPKKSLWKPGAEKICSTFRIAIDPLTEDLSTSDEARYRVTARAVSQAGGVYLGSALGECSSSEEKYRWRAVVHQKEWDATPEDRRRIKYTREGGEIRQVRTNHADVANTILKMATKRAMIAVVLQVTAASDIFDQDIEDLPEELQESVGRASSATHLREPQPVRQQPPATSVDATIQPELDRLADEVSGRQPGAGVRVESVRVAKKGTSSKGNPYTLTIIKLTDGQEYSTFDDGIAVLAKGAREKGSPVAFSFEETERGRKLTNLEVLA